MSEVPLPAETADANQSQDRTPIAQQPSESEMAQHQPETGSRTEAAVIAMLEANMFPVARKGPATGWEYFEQSRHLPDELRHSGEQDRLITPVIATTHHTDNDIPMTFLRVARKIPAGVASFSVNQEGGGYGR